MLPCANRVVTDDPEQSLSQNYVSRSDGPRVAKAFLISFRGHDFLQGLTPSTPTSRSLHVCVQMSDVGGGRLRKHHRTVKSTSHHQQSADTHQPSNDSS